MRRAGISVKPRRLIHPLCLVSFGWALTAGAAPAAADTSISLTFNSAIDNQYQARQILADHGMDGSFYVNSGRVGFAGRLTWRQVTELAQDGNEIGGQSINNFDLTTLTPEELEHQVCDDRTTLSNRGYSPVSFAHPTGSVDATPTVNSMIEQCGYSSARGDAGLGNVGQPDGESIPPANTWDIRTRGSIDDNDTLAEIQEWIQEAEAEGAGGHNWFPIAFNNICDGPVPATCPASRITTSDFDALLDWLQPRAADGTHVRTVRQVMTGTDQPEPPPVPGTVVSLTFDDGNDNQVNAQPILQSHGMDGTFYIISGRVGNPGYVTWPQIASLEADGNEIGGHTATHADLRTLTPAQQQAEICNGRQALINQGFEQVSFAYPFGGHDATSRAAVEACGYSSGRGVAGIGGAGEPKGETIPPADPWVVRTRGSVDVNDTLAEVQDWIMDAELSGDGWIPLVFHHICDGPISATCPDSRMTPTDFDALLDWLQPREAMGTEVKTIQEVIDTPPPPDIDTSPPTSSITCDGASCAPSFLNAASVTLAGSDTGGSGLKDVRFTTDGSLPTGFSPVYTGPIQITGTTTFRFRAADNHGNVESPTQSVTVRITDAPPKIEPKPKKPKCKKKAKGKGKKKCKKKRKTPGKNAGG